MSLTINTDSGIGSDVRVKSERPEKLTLAQGLSLSEWVQESRPIWSSLLLVLTMARKAVIGGAPDVDWYGVHTLDGLGSLR